MISIPPSVSPTISAVASHRVSSHPRSRKWLIVLCTVLAVLLGGAGSIASAQTAHFSGALSMSTVGSGFNTPYGVAVDSAGNIYVADTMNNAVKEVLAVNGSIPASPTIVTLGSGFKNPIALALDGSGNVYVADAGNLAVKEILAVNGSIPASPTIRTLITLYSPPYGVAVDSNGNVYVSPGVPEQSLGNLNSTVKQSLATSSSSGNNPVEELLAVNGSIPASPVVVSFNDFASPAGLALDSSGDLYVADDGSNTVMEILAINGSVSPSSTIRTVASFSGSTSPTGVAVDGSGNVYVADPGNNIIYEMLAVDGTIPASPTITTIGSGFNVPTGVTTDHSGDVYVADAANSRIVKLSLSIGSFGAVNIGTTSPAIPMNFTFDTAGTLGSMAALTQGVTGLDFADAGTGTCKANTAYAAGQICTINVIFTPKFAGTRNGAAVLYNTAGIVIATGYAQGTGVGPQIAFPQGALSTLSNGLNNPTGVAVDGSGNIYVADPGSNAVKEILAVNGSIPASPTIRILGSGFNQPSSVALDGSGNVYVADTGNSAVKEILAVKGGIPASPAIVTLGSGFNTPYSAVVDRAGNVFVADYGNSEIKEILAVNGSIPASPTILTLETDAPAFYLTIDGSGNVYFTGYDSPIVELLAVNGSIPASPTGKLIGGTLNYSTGLAVDAGGNVYVANDQNAVSEIYAVNGSIPSSPTITTLSSAFNYPTGLAVDSSGNIYIADPGNYRVAKLDFVDPPSLTFAPTSVGATSVDSPRPLEISNIGNALLTFPIPSTGTNPTIPASFTLNGTLGSTCPPVSAGSSEQGFLPPGYPCVLPISFVPASVGNLSGSIVLTDNNLNAAAPSYATQSILLSGTATQTVPTITWYSPAPITYGTPLSATQLNATSNVAGTFTYSPAAGTVLTAGQQTLTATFTPTNSTEYTTTSATVMLTVNQATPAITWATPAAITYGTPLSAAQLNASSTVAGTFTYSPAAGTVLTAGQQTLTATFTPTDMTDYTTASANVTLTVNQATPAITWATPAAITYGTPLSAAQLSASSTVAGNFTYSPAAGTVLTAGQQTLTATFTPTDTTDYTTATATVTLTVNQATPVITWATPAAITYGTPLSATQLNATSTVAGSFTYSPAAGTVLGAGAQTLTVTFVPTDSTDYTTAMASMMLTVNKATPAITWVTPAAITYGTPLSATQLNASSAVAGTFTYSPAAGTLLTAGTQTLTAAFTPTDTADYVSASTSITLTVNKATPSITWATPAAITYGTPLSATQLNASSTVAGTFIYSPAAGIVLNAGQQTLTATFTPTDTTDYATASTSVALTVNKATPAITWATPASINYGTALSATQLNASSTVAGSFTYSPAAGGVLTAGQQMLTVAFTPYVT